VAYPGRTTLIAIRCEHSSVAFKVNVNIEDSFGIRIPGIDLWFLACTYF